MKQSSEKDQKKNKFTEIRTFPVQNTFFEIKGDLTINTNTPTKPSKEQIINEAFNFHSKGNIPEAEKLYQYFINQGFTDHRVFSNYGVILEDLGKLKDAEFSYYKEIEIKSDYAIAHSNLGKIFDRTL